MNSTTVLLARRREAVTKESIVLIDGEARATIVPALNDVLRESGRVVAGQARHRALLGRTEQRRYPRRRSRVGRFHRVPRRLIALVRCGRSLTPYESKGCLHVQVHGEGLVEDFRSERVLGWVEVSDSGRAVRAGKRDEG